MAFYAVYHIPGINVYSGLWSKILILYRHNKFLSIFVAMSFTFQQFGVRDGRCAMKVGTDGVLLGAWTQASPSTVRVADFGAGSGLVSLMIAQRCPGAYIDAFETDSEACLDCRENFLASPWSDRLKCVQADALTADGCYDLVVSNPPFFGEELRSPDERRAAARHCGGLSPLAVVEIAARTLTESGGVALVMPAGDADEVIYRAEMLHLKERRRLDVIASPGRAPMRTLLQFGRQDGPPVRETLTVRDAGGAYSSEYARLTGDFYLYLPQ